MIPTPIRIALRTGLSVYGIYATTDGGWISGRLTRLREHPASRVRIGPRRLRTMPDFRVYQGMPAEEPRHWHTLKSLREVWIEREDTP